jgi:hypothetical protein
MSWSGPSMGVMLGWFHLHLILKWQQPFCIKYLHTCTPDGECSLRELTPYQTKAPYQAQIRGA